MINLYYIFTILIQIRFFIPVIVIYLLNKNLSLSQIAVLQSIYFISTALLQIPTGYFADRFSRKKSIILVTFFGFIGDLLFYNGIHFSTLIFSQILWALGEAFLSGAAEALFYENLKCTNRSENHMHFRSQILFASVLVAAAANGIGGFLANISLDLPVLATLPISFLVLILSLFFKETKINLESNKKGRFSINNRGSQGIC